MLHLDVEADAVVALALIVTIRTAELRRRAALKPHVALEVVHLRVGLEALWADVALRRTAYDTESELKVWSVDGFGC